MIAIKIVYRLSDLLPVSFNLIPILPYILRHFYLHGIAVKLLLTSVFFCYITTTKIKLVIFLQKLLTSMKVIQIRRNTTYIIIL